MMLEAMLQQLGAQAHGLFNRQAIAEPSDVDVAGFLIGIGKEDRASKAE